MMSKNFGDEILRAERDLDWLIAEFCAGAGFVCTIADRSLRCWVVKEIRLLVCWFCKREEVTV